MKRRSHKRLGVITGIAVLVAAATVLIATTVASGQPTASGILREVRLEPSKAPKVTARVVLRHQTVVAGGTIRGRVIVDNSTRWPKTLERSCFEETASFFDVGLRSATRANAVQFADAGVACRPRHKLIAEPGFTSYRFKVTADYTSCTQRAKGSTAFGPACLKGAGGERDITPPLPSGRYSAVFESYQAWHGPHVQPSRLVVTKNR